jgi:hypothetical protein
LESTGHGYNVWKVNELDSLMQACIGFALPISAIALLYTNGRLVVVLTPPPTGSTLCLLFLAAALLLIVVVVVVACNLVS